jgi:hypothetical protein
MINKQTTLDLNGPILSFIQQPQSVSVDNGTTATFVGIATATFPTQTPTNPTLSTGTLSYRWNVEGFGPLTDGTFQSASITGSGTTTLTITNVTSPTTNGLRLFVGVDYVPSAYSQPVGSAVTVGTARSTGNAVNEILNSDTATLTVNPFITIINQPQDTTSVIGGRATFVVNAEISDNRENLFYQWQLNGENLVDEISQNIIVSGSRQPILIISPNSFDDFFNAKIRVIISSPNAITVISDVAKLTVISARSIIIFEGYDNQNNYVKKEVSLENGANFTLTDETFGPNFNIITFYASEKNIDTQVEIRSSSGSNLNTSIGGQGGVSVARFTMQLNQEYTALGISNNSAIFLYRGANLIAVVGKGGDAGSFGNGGSGGGLNLPGNNGGGRNSGLGGSLISVGQLTTTGIFGSNSSVLPQNILSGDSKTTIPNGGRTISCPKGFYWINQGRSPCQSNGITQFRNTDGTLIPLSALITRGFKPDYTISATGGKSTETGGNGGNGATGGSGGREGGGGGGSGYSDGSISILSNTIGGNTAQKSTINFRVFQLPLIGTVSHIHNNASFTTISLIFGGGISSAFAGGSPSDRYYDVSFPFNTVSLVVTSFGTLTAGGRYDPNMRVTSIQKLNSTTYRIRFIRGNGNSTYINTFSVAVSP